jgi:hypothetical protein
MRSDTSDWSAHKDESKYERLGESICLLADKEKTYQSLAVRAATRHNQTRTDD